jgi:hypothetical protein
MAHERSLLVSLKGAHVVRRFFSLVRQYESHRQLIASVRPNAGRRPTGAGLDAIIVPASRHASNLEPAVTLARAARCLLVVFCSHETRIADVQKVLANRCFGEAAIVELPHGYDHKLLRFESSDIARAGPAGLCINPNGDLSVKRNLGLLLARMVGWRRIFFMDDDVRDIGLGDLATTVSLLARYRSVGMRVIDVADNSVVCHAHRETGADQDVFISGSALAVRPHTLMGFFPTIYNEDWFFFHDDAQGRRLGWSGRNATQLRYDPFENVLRAERQEFGDLLAEGLYSLLHLSEERAATNIDFWKTFLAVRRRFLRDILDRSNLAAPEIRVKMTEAVHTAMRSLQRIDPWMCEEYVQAWRRDLKSWKDTLTCLQANLSVDSALAKLGLSSANGGLPARQSPAERLRVSRNGVAGAASIPGAPTAVLLQGWSKGGSPVRHRRTRVFEEAGLQIFAPAMQRNPVEADAGKGVPWAEADAETQPLSLGSLDSFPGTGDPDLQLLSSGRGLADADLAEVGGSIVRVSHKAFTSPQTR